MSAGLFFSQKFQNVCAGLFFLRSAPKMAKIFWRFAPKHSDFAFKYDQKCSKKIGASRRNIAILPLNMIKNVQFFSGASRQNIAILPLNMVENAQNFPALRAGSIFDRGVIFFSKVFNFLNFSSPGLFFLKNLSNVAKICYFLKIGVILRGFESNQAVH